MGILLSFKRKVIYLINVVFKLVLAKAKILSKYLPKRTSHFTAILQS